MKKLFFSFIFISNGLLAMQSGFNGKSLMHWQQTMNKHHDNVWLPKNTAVQQIICDDGTCIVSNDICNQWPTIKCCLENSIGTKNGNEIDCKGTILTAARLNELLHFKKNPTSYNKKQLEQLFVVAHYLEAIQEMRTIVQRYLDLAPSVKQPSTILEQIKKCTVSRTYTNNLPGDDIKKLYFTIVPLALSAKITHSIAYRYIQMLDERLKNCDESHRREFNNQRCVAIELLQQCPLKGYKHKYFEWNELHLENNGFENLDGLESIIDPKSKINCAKLYLNTNNLTDCNVVELLQIFPNLRVLNLANNKIQRLKNNSFAHMPSMFNLDLSNNGIHTIEPNAFSNNIYCRIELTNDISLDIARKLKKQLKLGLLKSLELRLKYYCKEDLPLFLNAGLVWGGIWSLIFAPALANDPPLSNNIFNILAISPCLINAFAFLGVSVALFDTNLRNDVLIHNEPKSR